MIDMKVLASGSAGNCYIVSDGSTELLLEAGIPLRQIREGLDFNLSRVAGCLVSHEHGDHAKAVKDLLKAGVDVYASEGTIDALNLRGHHRAHVIRAQHEFQIGTWTVLPFEAVHDCAEPLSFLMASGDERFLFVTDSGYVKYRFKGLTHIALEANYDPAIISENVSSGVVERQQKRRTMRAHMSIETALDFFRANDMSRVQQIYLLHLSSNNSHEVSFKEQVQRLTGKPVICC